MSQSSATEFDEDLTQLKANIASVDPFNLLSVLANYGLNNGLTKTGERAKRDIQRN